MLILFSLIVMRMSGLFLMNPVFGSSVVPSRVRAALVMVFSLMLYIWQGGVLSQEPGSFLEFGVMLLLELGMGLVLGFAVQLVIFAVRYASAIIDFSMGLSMAQVYDPETRTQMTVSSELYYSFLMLLFFAVNGHLHLIEIFFGSAELVPFGQVALGPGLYVALLDVFKEAVLLGFQIAFPVIAMELVTEAAVGVLMRMVPQINVFAVNFQIKIIVGMLMLMILFSPLADKLSGWINGLFPTLENLIALMRG